MTPLAWQSAAALLSTWTREASDAPGFDGDVEWWSDDLRHRAFGYFVGGAACVVIELDGKEHDFRGEEADRLRYCGAVGAQR